MPILRSGRFPALAAVAVAVAAAAFAAAVLLAVTTSFAAAAPPATPFLNSFSSISTVASAVPAAGPAKGDQNPYGVAIVPHTVGALVQGDVLVSNFNNALNQQGTGSSIVEISPGRQQRVFSVVPRPTATPAVGLTTALAVLPHGYVVVGSLPAPGGDSRKATAGALTILGPMGRVVKTIAEPDINGPWDMTEVDQPGGAVLFVTNVLNGTVAAGGKVVKHGTVVRIRLAIGAHSAPVETSHTVIATGFAERTDPNALVVGPTGVGLGSDGTLYVADSNNNRIAAVPRALTRTSPRGGGGATVTSGGALSDPLGLAIAPGGDIITANGANGNVVETTPGGTQVAAKTLVPNGAGDLFGIAIRPTATGMYFVNDAGSGPAANSLQLLH